MRNSIDLSELKKGGVKKEATSRPINGVSKQRTSSQHGARTHHSFHEENSNHEQELKNFNKNFEELNINEKGKKNNKFRQLGGKSGKNKEEEEELSSLSGFTASDAEENDDIKFKGFSKTKKNRKQVSDDEDDLDQENQDIVLNPKDDLKARFEHYETLRRKNEEERRQREILGTKSVGNIQNIPLKRPHSSHGALKTSDTMIPKNITNRQKENIYGKRPQTAHMRLEGEDDDRKTVTFKPVYTKAYQQTLIEKKVFNYTVKNFKTIAKKSDPVSRFKAFSTQWNKSKFLKNNPKMKEGRKLNLAERNQTSKPEFVFHRY